ncbi:hypothetical protein SPI_04372 [Niveomyces insectorum RCEF 264]|uniref:Nuclear membrane fusion protein Kar5 n=1 Tax=Niveomyces insectorum RCEF 264 TaxID=1081102 RepID=A0A162J2E6_9HYPO|nr:hypothetical protein SPI_04372 [Niveomyces insectorum RCEF 264]
MRTGDAKHSLSLDVSPSELLQSGSKRSVIYQLALHELQELEAEPLCHRIAARLLVNNCQLLDGKDDATVLTDSGRQARDFVDAYAASLAICDLERASFAIPVDCEPFREPALSQLPLGGAARLHVSSAQIKACLKGLGDSSSAWNTWVSYSHKAVRFCEAARADQEKTQNILLFQKLTRVMAKLADSVEAELQRRAEAWDLAAQEAEERLSQLSPRVDQLWQRLTELSHYIEDDLAAAITQTASSAADGFHVAENLHQLLAVIMKTALEGHAQVAFAHEQSLEHVKQKVAGEVDIFTSSMLAVMSSSVSLQNEIGMQRLAGLSYTLSSDYSNHARLLGEANNLTNNMLDTLETTAVISSNIQNSLLRQGALRDWWPYVLCPAASLIMGSYGLPPSLLRNMGLFAIGELLGVLVSSYGQLSNTAFRFFTTAGLPSNVTDI